jgi:hypothetical protein
MTGKWYKISAHRVNYEELTSWLTENIGLKNWDIRSDFEFCDRGLVIKYYWVKIKNKKKAFLLLLMFR